MSKGSSAGFDRTITGEQIRLKSCHPQLILVFSVFAGRPPLPDRVCFQSRQELRHNKRRGSGQRLGLYHLAKEGARSSARPVVSYIHVPHHQHHWLHHGWACS